jgi:hypothetical protein
VQRSKDPKRRILLAWSQLGAAFDVITGVLSGIMKRKGNREQGMKEVRLEQKMGRMMMFLEVGQSVWYVTKRLQPEKLIDHSSVQKRKKRSSE